MGFQYGWFYILRIGFHPVENGKISLARADLARPARGKNKIEMFMETGTLWPPTPLQLI